MDFLSLSFFLSQVHYKQTAFEIRYLHVHFSLSGSSNFPPKKKGEVIYNTNSLNPRDSELFRLERAPGVSIF